MQKFLQPFPQLSLILSFSSFTQMKSQAVFGALVTWLLIGRTKQRASLTSLLKVRLEKSQQIQDLHVHTAMWLLLFCKITVNSWDIKTLLYFIFIKFAILWLTDGLCDGLLSRLRLPPVSRGELSAGPDRSLSGGGRQTLPVCVQPHHQRQACESTYWALC